LVQAIWARAISRRILAQQRHFVPAIMVDTTKLYKLLAVSKQASTAEIRRAYRTLSLKHHPDKVGDEATFTDMRHAYEVLSDKDNRAQGTTGTARKALAKEMMEIEATFLNTFLKK